MNIETIINKYVWHTNSFDLSTSFVSPSIWFCKAAPSWSVIILAFEIVNRQIYTKLFSTKTKLKLKSLKMKSLEEKKRKEVSCYELFFSNFFFYF